MTAEILVAAGAWLVTYALHSSVILAAALLACGALTRLARRRPVLAGAVPALRERIWKAALVGGLATASLQTAAGIEPFGLRPALFEPEVARPADAAPAEPAPALLRTTAPTVPLLVLPAVEIAARMLDAAAEPSDSGVASHEPAAPLAARTAALESPAPPRAPGLPLWIGLMLCAWALGMACGALRWLRGWVHLRRSLAARGPVVAGTERAMFDALCARAGVEDVALSAAPRLAVPLTRGIVRREVCVPPRALTELSADELRALFAHEIAHAARRDTAWLALSRAVEVVGCLQPLNRIVARRLEDDAELLCDDRAVVLTGERLPLAACLAEVAGWFVHAPRAPRLAAGMAAHGMRLTQRVERLIDDAHRPAPDRARPALALATGGVLLAVALLVPGFAGQRPRPLPLDAQFELLAATAPADSDAPDDPPDHPCLDAPEDEGPPVAAGEPCEDPEPEAGADDPLGEELDELDAELARLADALAERTGGEALQPALSALGERVRALRRQEDDLREALRVHALRAEPRDHQNTPLSLIRAPFAEVPSR